MNHPLIVILAAGISSRMKQDVGNSDLIDQRLAQDADQKSKSMIGVGKEYRPFLDYLLLNINAAGYKEAVIVINEKDESIRGYYEKLGEGNRFLNLSLSYAVQSVPAGRTKPLGTADALLQALASRPDWSGKRFSVCNSDNLYSVRALRILLESTDRGALIDYDRRALEFDQARIERFAVIRTDKDGYLSEIIEKPSPSQISSLTSPDGRVGVSMNIFCFSYDLIVPYIQSVPLHPVRQEKELPLAVLKLVNEQPRTIRAIPLAEHVPDLTHKGDISKVQEYLRRNYSDISGKNAL